MTNADKVSVLSGALHALTVSDETRPQAQKVADMLAESCQKVMDEKASEQAQ